MEFDADVNYVMRAGFTALMIAVRLGHSEVVRCLGKELGADVDLAMQDGSTVLMITACHG
jgi:ankyrin repeat protein